MLVADLVADALDRHCAGPIFGVLGEGTLAVTDRLVHRHGRRTVAAAREDGAVSMADGFSRVSGALGLAAVTHGPGLTNTMTALTEAARARTPMVLLAGDTPAVADGNPQVIDQAAVVAPTGAAFHPVRCPETAATDLLGAFVRARSERIPVVVDLPTDLLHEPVPPDDVVPGPDDGGTSSLLPPTSAVDAVVGALASAEKVVVLAGRGAIASRDEVVALADHLGAWLATTLLAKGLFSGHARDVGVCGGFSDPRGQDVLAAADVVISLGASLSRFTLDDGRLLTGAAIIRVDSDESVLSLADDRQLTVHADTSSFCTALTARIARVNRVEAVGPVATGSPARRHSGSGRGLDLHDVVHFVDGHLPDDRVVVVDGGHAALSEPSRSVRVNRPDSFVFPLHFGSIGLSLSTAIGAAIAADGRPTVCFVGDGGLMMCIAELDTVARAALPLTIVVMNDSAYGWEYHQMAEAGIDTGLSVFERPSFADLASAFGLDAVQVSDLDQLRAVGDRVRASSGPLLIDACLDRDVRTEWYGEHAAPARSMGDTVTCA